MAEVCVYCSSSEDVDARYKRLAAEVGTELALRGHTLVSGGGRVSCMGAVANAARAGGAHTVGVIPTALTQWEVADTEADELIVTGGMRERKAEMERRADGFLVLPGGLGTLEEMFEIWVGRTLGFHAKPLVVLDNDGLYAPLRQQIARLVDGGFVRAGALDHIGWATTVPEAFDLLEKRWAGPGPRPGPALDELLEE